MKTVHSIADVRQAMEQLTGSVGLVPTMGALHAGHLALISAARAENDAVIVSLFVNPSQFGPQEDLQRYPRDEEADERSAERAGVDLLFAPSVEEMYRDGFQTWVEVRELGGILEGEVRPGHFRGVATVCLKLFNIAQPHRAYFGQKDAQQASVIRRMVRDLDLPIEIRVVPIVRDPDGLALSSRNVYLSPGERARALALPRALEAGRQAWRSGADPVAATCRGLERLTVEYVSVADLDGPTLAAAVRIGQTRLIDNVRLEEEASAS